MIGIGTPSNHSRIPRPIDVSYWCACDNVKLRLLVPSLPDHLLQSQKAATRARMFRNSWLHAWRVPSFQ